MKKFVFLLGEEDSNSVDNTIEEGSKIKIPYWLGKMLYDASQGRKVPDYFPEFQAAGMTLCRLKIHVPPFINVL